MKTIVYKTTVLLCLLFIAFPSRGDVNFDEYFKDQTMRLDFFHTGTSEEEHFSLDRMINDGVWAGSKTQLIDELELGKYFFELKEPETGEILYSRGFSSIYGEWETTPAAKEEWGVFHESLLFPWPKEPVDLVLYKRNDQQEFEPVWELTVDPEHRKVNRAKLNSPYNVYDAHISGDPHEKVDIVVLSEGYTEDEMDKFRKDVDQFKEALFTTEPFASRKEDFNIRGVEVPAPNSGLNHPQQDIYNRSALSVTYGAFGSERYALGYDNRRIRDAASTVPYEFTAVLMNDSIYGGGGIYGLYITAAADNAFHDYLFVHEFGHHFASLADEYYASATAYEMGSDVVEPYELNVTTYTDKDKIKWGDLIDEETALPTPWGKEKFDEHSIEIQKKREEMRKAKVGENKMEQFFKEQQDWEDNHLDNIEYANTVGAFEGAMYHAKGIYRSEPNCIMFTRTDSFCAACQRAINLVIDQYTK
ncbi:MAG: M64 family metallopeptidase [Bacteroidales bacterium]